MNAQDRLREAATAIAATVHDVRPLSLPDEEPLASPKRRREHRWLSWMVPMAAAAAVVAVAATLVAVRSLPHHIAPSADRSSPPSIVPGPAPGALAIPRYYVALGRVPGGGIGVGDTQSSRWVATVGLPPGSDRFAGVTGAADDRTFVVDIAQSPPPGTTSKITPRIWYLLRIAPGTDHAARLISLAVPPTPNNTLVTGIALSPDGTELAVLSQLLQPSVYVVPGPVTLRIYSVATGAALRTWTGPTYQTSPEAMSRDDTFDENTTLTWVAGNRLAFSYLTEPGDRIVARMLNLALPGTGLIADSSHIASPRKTTDCLGSLPLVTADGRLAVCGTQAYGAGGLGSCYAVGRLSGGKPRFVEYATKTGWTTVLYRYPDGCITGFAVVYWASPSGDAVIGQMTAYLQFQSSSQVMAGLFTDATFQPLDLHMPPPQTNADWSDPYAF
jgi:hypothetical protein